MCYGFLLLLTVFNSLLWSVIVCYCLLLFVIVVLVGFAFLALLAIWVFGFCR